MEITVKEFREQYLPELEGEFQEKTQLHITEHRREIFQEVQQKMEQFIMFLGQFQQRFPIEIGEIQVALLQTSVHMGNPQIAVCCYDEDGILGNELLNVRFDVKWLFSEWENYKERITDKVNALNAQNYIRPEAITQMMWIQMEYLQACLYATLKYHLRNFGEMKGYEQLELSPRFRMTVGGYRDNCGVVYRVRNEIDLFMRSGDEKLDYCRFYEVVYNKKTFQKLKLNSTVFCGCEFIHCNFSEVVLRDAIFENCRFYHCNFENVDFCGATFEGTTIKKCAFKNTMWHMIPDDLPVLDVYKNVELNQSILEGLVFEESDICEIYAAQSDIKDITLIACKNDGVVFKEVE